MASGRDKHHRMRSFDRSFDFSVDKEDGIQLTDRQVQLRQQRFESGASSTVSATSARPTRRAAAKPFETRSNKHSQHHTMEMSTMKSARNHQHADPPRATTGGPRSSASTTLYRSEKERQDQKALLRKVLASKAAANASTARSVASTSAKTPYSLNDRRAFLKRVVAERKGTTPADDSPESGARTSVSTNATSNHEVDQKALLRQVLAKTKAKKQQQQQQQHVDNATDAKINTGTDSRAEQTHYSWRREATNTQVTTKEPVHQRQHVVHTEIAPVAVELKPRHTAGAPEKEVSIGRASGSSHGLTEEATVRSEVNPPYNSQENTKTKGLEDTIRDRSKRKPDSAGSPVRRRKKGKEKSEPLIQSSVAKYDMMDINPSDHKKDPPQSLAGSRQVTSSSLHSQHDERMYSVEDPDWAAPIENQDDGEGFTEFMDSLKKEVSSDHIELWRSFQSLFYGKKKVPKSTSQRPKRISFDDKTKETLATMNLYVKSSSVVECVTETQLVNDKRFAREKRQESSSRESSNNDVRESSAHGKQKELSQKTSSEDKQTLTTREYLEKARKRLAERKSMTRTSASYSKLSSPPSLRMHAVKVPDQNPPKDHGTDTLVPEWPQPDEELEQTALSPYDEELDRMTQHEKRMSWLTMHRARKAQTVESHSDVDGSDNKENDTRPPWPILRNVDEQPSRHAPSEGKMERSPAQTQRPMPWLVALQERKAREEREAEIQSCKDDQTELITFVQIPKEETQSTTLSSSSVDADGNMSIARQRSLLDDGTDEEGETCATPKSIESLSGQKRRQGALVVETPVNSGESSVPIRSTAKLRTAPQQHQNESRGTDNFLSASKLRDTSHRGYAQSECGVPWSTIKLRKVASKDEHEEKTSGQKEEPLPFRQMLRRVPSAALRNRTIPSGVRIDDDSEGAPVLPPGTSWEQSSPDKDGVAEGSGVKVGDEIDLHNLPNDLSEQHEQPFIMQLQQSPGMPKTDKISVVVGKQVLMTVRSHDTTEHSRVTWHVSRRRVQSLTLDTAENRADLSLSNNRTKSLAFGSTEDCLNFANAFYLTKTLEHTREEDHQLAVESSTASKDEMTENMKGEIDTPSKQLSEEEEKLLETYRLMRKTKAPEEAMRETMANKAIDHTSPLDSPLSEEEEKVASRFRKMLKMSIPPEAVRHEMTMEQISEKIAKAVLGEAKSNKEGSSSFVEASPPRLSEEEEKIASTYRKMLKMMVPSDAVRHRMTKDNVDPKIVADVLGDGPNTSNDSTKNSSSTLSDAEEKIASTYRKMLKMMIPPDAVRHRMTKDKVDSKIVVAVLGDDPNAPKQSKGVSPSTLSEDEEKVATTYRKMLKMMIPPDAVRHRMTKDKVDSKIVVAVLGDDPNAPKKTETCSVSALSDAEEKVASTYRKMLKMMIPPDAVRHRMTKDKVDHKIVTAVLGNDKSDDSEKLSPSEEKIAERFRLMIKRMVPIDAVRHNMEKENVDPKVIAAVLGPDAVEKAQNALTEEEEKVASTYRKMLKMNITKDAVRHKMVSDGVQDKIISVVLCDTPSKSSTSSKPVVKGSKLVSLHWTPLSGEELDNSVWRASKKRKVNADGKDVSKLVELFQKKSNPRSGKAVSTNNSSASGSGDEMAKLIDLNRANNIAISLKAFKEFSHKELADTIRNLDPRRIIQGERCQFVKDLLPNASESKAVKAYKGPEKKLVPAELFFRELVNVPRIEVKVGVMQTMDTFEENARELSSRFQMLSTVCRQVVESEKLQDVLEMVLQVGNIMNEGTKTGGAAGFKFDSLLKLTQTKSADGKTTVLDYLVMIFMAKNRRETLQLTAEFPEVQTAARMALNDMVTDVRGMGGALNKCKAELINMKKDGTDGPVTRSMSKKFGASVDGNTSTADPRNALLAAIQAKGQKEVPKPFDKREQFLEGIRQQKPEQKEEQPGSVGEILNAITTCGQMDDVCDSDGEEARTKESSPRSKMIESLKADSVRKANVAVSESKKEDKVKNKSGTHADGVLRLESFVGEASTILSELEGDRDNAVNACKALSKYCGEGGGERAAISLIGILSQFAINLDNAVQKYDAMEEARIRRETAMKKRESLEQNKMGGAQKGGTTQMSTGKHKSASKSPSKESKGPSLVLIVNDLLHSASDQAKEDFVKGVVYEKTSDTRLRTIYERERKSLGGVLMPFDEGRASILDAIKKRRKYDEDAPQKEASGV